MSAMQRLGQAAIMSAPAAAPVASHSLSEARSRARSFFRELAREVPWIVKNYQLGEITSVARLRSQLANHFRRVQTDNPKVVDLMLFKGQAEAHDVMAHHTQRHHLVRGLPARAGGAQRP
jgi:NADH dehydrogenase (ubiquinone) 1 alpha subcomplex subunit 6